MVRTMRTNPAGWGLACGGLAVLFLLLVPGAAAAQTLDVAADTWLKEAAPSEANRNDPGRRSSSGRVASRPGSVPRGASADTAARRAESWEQVDRALSRNDEAGARRALTGLAESRDAATRAKALLGLAQLAAAQGDCRHARSLAAEIAGTPGASARLSSRARNLARNCR